GPEPVLVFLAQRVSLTELGMPRVLGNHVEYYFGDCSQPFRGVLVLPFPRMFRLERFDLQRQLLDLLQEQRVSKKSPAVDDQGLRRNLGHSSSGDSTASRSTTTPRVRDFRRLAKPASSA